MSAQPRTLLEESAELDLRVGRREAIRRIYRAMDYVETHLAEPIRLKQLAAQAHFSTYHFVRVFTAVTGETPVQHLRRIRLIRAAILLYAWPQASVLDIALATGFHSAAAFARAFHQEFGMNSSAWRRADFWHPCGRFPCWRASPCPECGAKVEPVDRSVTSAALEDISKPQALGEIKVAWVPARRIAYMRGIGPFTTNFFTLWHRLIRWLVVRGLYGPESVLFAQLLDSPFIAAPRQFRYDVGLLIDEAFVPDRYVNVRELSSGWFVTAPLTGTVADEGRALTYLRRVWVPAHGYAESGARYYICMRRRDNMSLSDIRLENVLNSAVYLPILPPNTRSPATRPLPSHS